LCRLQPPLSQLGNDLQDVYSLLKPDLAVVIYIRRDIHGFRKDRFRQDLKSENSISQIDAADIIQIAF
jgi:hypothetical protein